VGWRSCNERQKPIPTRSSGFQSYERIILKNCCPIFLFTLHRGGGSALSRVINCHPKIVIWGEHAGFINKLAEMDDLITRTKPLMDPKTDAQIAQFVSFPATKLTTFDPWANPFEYSRFRDSCREMILSIFTRGLTQWQRWGFKEIRYHRLLTARFLNKMFPDCRFVILRRDLREVAVSSILAPWSLEALSAYREQMPPAVAEAVVADVTYAILAIERGFDDIKHFFGPRCFELDHRQLLDSTQSFVPSLFDFCQLGLTEHVVSRVARVLKVRSGGTPRDQAFGGILNADFIAERAAAFAPRMRDEIARDGINNAKLMAKEGPRGFSFLMGDHGTRDSAVSSMF
jgi:hypothetical protein